MRVRRRLFHRRGDDSRRLLPGPGVHGDETAQRHDGRSRARLQVDRETATARHRRGLPQLAGQLHDIRAHGQRDQVRGTAQIGGRVCENGECIGHLVPQPLHTAGGSESTQVSEQGTDDFFLIFLPKNCVHLSCPVTGGPRVSKIILISPGMFYY